MSPASSRQMFQTFSYYDANTIPEMSLDALSKQEQDDQKEQASSKKSQQLDFSWDDDTAPIKLSVKAKKKRRGRKKK